jgi:hypothetical protein
MGQEAATVHQMAGCGTPRASLRLARGPGVAPRSLRLARGPDALSGESPPRSRDRDPRASLHLARGPDTSLCLARGTGTPERVSASLEATSDPRRRTYSPDRSIKCPGTSQALGAKANPHHADPLTSPWNHIPALFHQPTLCDHPRCCVGAVREGRCHSMTLYRPLPYLLYVVPLERGRWHPRKGYVHIPCARLGRCHDVRPAERVSSVISGPVRPSPSLCCHPGCCASPSALWEPRSTGHRHTGRCAAPVFRQPSPRTGVRMATVQEAPTPLPSKPLLDEHRTRHDARQRQDSSGQPSTP